MIKFISVFSVLATIVATTACSTPANQGDGGPPGDGNPNNMFVAMARARMPFAARRLTLPMGVQARAVWIGNEGEGVFASLTGDLYAFSPRGDISAVDRVPGETATVAERRITALATRSPGEILAATAGSALLIQNSLSRRAQLPAVLNAATSLAVLNGASLWGTSSGLYLSSGRTFLQLNDARGPVNNVDTIASITADAGALEFWLKTGPNVRRLRYVDGSAPTFTEMPVNLALGAVFHLASMGDDRAVVSTERGVYILRGNEAGGWVNGASRSEPGAVGGGGGKAWVIWGTDVLRTDGTTWEALARDPRFGPNCKIAVDSSGNSAMVIDDDGAVVRIDVEERVRVSGFRDADLITTPTLGIEVLPWRSAEPTEVSWFVDGEMPATAVRMMAPWGWGYNVDVNGMGMVVVTATGTRTREIGTQLPNRRTGPYGGHFVRVVVRHGMESIERTLSFEYASPFGRIPTYNADIAPIYNARCARCHQNSVAEELSTFELLRNKRGALRQALRERRMPPDLPLDSVSEALFLAWIDGNFPQ